MHDVRGELKLGRKVGEQLLEIAQRYQDPALLLEAHHELWANLLVLGDLRSARTHLEQGFSLYDPQKHRHHAFLYGGHDPGVCCGFHAADVLWFLGYPTDALRKSKEALALARELSHPSTLHIALSFIAWFYFHRGDGQGVKAMVEECITLGAEQGFSRGGARANFLQGWLLVEQGQQEAGVAQMSKILAEQRDRAGPERWSVQYAAVLAQAHRKAGQIRDGLAVITNALAVAQQSECRHYDAELHRIKGELLVTQRPAEEQGAEACFNEALKISRGQSAKSLELRAAMNLSRLWQKQGKNAEAKNLLAEVYGWFTEGFDTADLKTAKALLDEVS